MDEQAWFSVTLRDWLEHQRHAHIPHHRDLIAALHRNDPAAVRALLADTPFTPEQRRYLDDLLNRWQAAIHNPAD